MTRDAAGGLAAVRFHDRVRRLGRVEHPNLLRVYDAAALRIAGQVASAFDALDGAYLSAGQLADDLRAIVTRDARRRRRIALAVDLHSHLLPGLDDGAPSMAEALRYARRLDAAGIRDVACTPHVKRAHFPFIDAHVDALELRANELAAIAQGPAHAPWLLLECPFEGFDDAFDVAAPRLGRLGYGLLLAHPERADGGLERLWPLVEAGALLQVNVSSLLGEHGPRARETSTALVRRGLAYCLASDGHPGTRELTLELGVPALERAGVSELQAFRLTQSNPRFLLREGNPRLVLPPTAEHAKAER